MAGIQFAITPQLPARITGVAPISVTKSGLSYSISLTGNVVGVAYNSFTVAGLSGALPGEIVMATDGRKIDEGPGLGTGVLVYFSTGSWRCLSTDAPVQV